MGRPARIRREDVLEAARAEFVERGYEGATLSHIASRLSVSAAALLRHERTKRDLFVAAMGQREMGPMPFEFLRDLDGSEDPRRVLRRAAQVLVPFLEARLRDSVARFVFFKTLSGIGPLPLPFDPEVRPTPPQRNLKYLEDYMRRAARRGRLRVANPRAAAFAFVATLHSFVFLQAVLQVLEEPMPLDEYLDTVLDIWTRGAVAAPAKKKGRTA